ncbi:MAG: YjjG family noncanonical pyrimidine nucleotidase [Bacteroidaceae bacterium]|nr:YjjG family noncanonical pyrimidine nucleotidase [Bacteroidaceae bacterium]
MSRYTTLFIDLDDTLFDFRQASRMSFHETYDLLGYERFFESFEHFLQIYEPRNRELWVLYGKGEIDKATLNRLRYSYPLEAVGHPDEELAARFCTEALSRIPHQNVLIPGAIELMEYLHPRYEMFILSNGFQELQSQKMATTGLSKYFKRLILSDEIGINKPNPELFHYALQVSGARKESCIMIGDMFETDIVGAANIGLDQIFVNIAGAKGLTFEPTYEVNNLLQIKDIL